MTLCQILERVDEVKPNLISEEIKRDYISELDTRTNIQILRRSGNIKYTDLDSDKELIIPSPFDRVYEYYLSAMIDYLNSEINSYNVNMALFNEKYEEYAKWYIRNNMPKNNGGFFGF